MIEPLATRFHRLEQARAAAEAQLTALTPSQTAFRVRDDAWTVAEVVDHVVRVERSVLEGARKPGVRRTGWRPKPLRRLLTWATFGMGFRIKVPERVRHVTPERGADLDEVRARWNALRDEWREFLATVTADQLGQLAIKHPIAGPFSYRDVLKFLEWHLRHHRRQIERILRAAASSAILLVTVAASCTYGNSINVTGLPLVQTSQSSYTAPPGALEIRIPVTLTNETGDALYLDGAGRDLQVVEKLVAGEWRVAYHPVYTMQAAEPIPLPAGASREIAVSLNLQPGTEPQFQEPPPGTYRLVFGYGQGAERFLSTVRSNEFQIVRE